MSHALREHDELFILTERLCEQAAGAHEIEQLNTLLAGDPDARRRYLDHVALHGELYFEQTDVAGRISVDPPTAPSPMMPVLSAVEASAANRRGRSKVQGSGLRVQKPTTPTLRRSRSVGYTFRDQGSGPRDQNKTSPMASPRAVGVALAATILLAVTAWFALPDFSNPQSEIRNPQSEIRNPQSFASVATLTNTTNAAFADTAAPMRLGGSLPAGPIHLTSGKAQIMFASTAVVDLTGPCEFEMTGPNRGRLTSGTLEAFVPENAQGFTVDLPDGSKIVDLGTAFRVKVDELGQSSVRVHSGTVLWTTDGPDGESVRISAGRIARMVEVAPKLTDPAAADVPVRTRIVTEAFATRVSNDDLATPVSVSLPDGWTLDTSIPHSHEAGILFDGIDANPGNGRVVWRRNDGAELSTSDYIAITGQLKQPWIVTDIRVAHDWGGGSKAEITDVQVALSNGAETLGTFSRGGLNDDVIEDIDEVATQRSVAPVTSFEFRITGGESQSLEVREIVIIGRPLGPEFEPEESGLKSDTCPEGEYE